jgi:hypothetical protein
VPPEEGQADDGQADDGQYDDGQYDDGQYDGMHDGETDADGQTPEYPQTPDGQVDPAEQSQRPQDVAEWKRDDYFSARADQDSRLVQAVEHMGRRFVGKDTAARMLAQLLEPPEAEENPDPQSQPGYGSQSHQPNPQLIQAIVAALGINGSGTSRTTLEQILAGTLATDDDQTAVGAALRALVADPSAQTDDVLFRAFSAADTLRPQPKGEIGADQLREMTLAAVSSTASEELRTKLARFMIRPNTPPQRREQIGGFLRVEHPDNVGAQLILYQSDETPPETKAAFERYFVGYSSAALAHALGIPGGQPGSPAGGADWRNAPGGGAYGESDYGAEADGPVSARPLVPGIRPAWEPPGGSNLLEAAARPPDPDAPFSRARQMWSAPTVALIEDRLDQLTSLEEQAALALLAGTIPADSTRTALWKTLHDHQADGPQQLEAAGLSTNLITDPGMLLSIKTLDRRMSTGSMSPSGGIPGGLYGQPRVPQREGYRPPGQSYPSDNRFRPGAGNRFGQSTTTEGVAAVRNAVQKQVETEQNWMKTSESLVRAWCERFRAAATAQAGAAAAPGGVSGQGGPGPNLPIRPHPEAAVLAEYHLHWPGDLGAKLSGVAAGAMEIHYFLLAERKKPLTTLGFYRRQLQLEQTDRRPIENGFWLDRIQRVSQAKEKGPVDKTDWKRSVDVLVTAADENQQRDRDGEIDLVVEILSIEMKDPSQKE